MINVLEYLEASAEKNPNKIAVIDSDATCTYLELKENARRIGSALAEIVSARKPVIVLMDKCIEALTSFMGIVYSGNFYTLVSPDQPDARIRQLLEVSQSDCIITLINHLHRLENIEFSGKILSYSTLVQHDINSNKLQSIRSSSLDIDPLYCNFTSGSTGVPKGVLVSHRSVIDFMEYFPSLFDITSKDIIGNQAPFDFDVSVKDIYSTLKVGATMVIIPKKLFSIPMQLLDYICDHEVTTLIWAVSALCMITQLKGFSYKVPVTVDKILFSGEAMPMKHLKIWQKYLPDAMYVNLYGPTEITCNCSYFRIDRSFELEETLPIGKAFPNEKVFLLDENDQLITSSDTVGEICVSGTALALGYYNNPVQTQKAFTQNPLNPYYIEPIYRTGDLAYYNGDHDLCFGGRKDFQIKHMGHRIELEEIELIINSFDKITRACCVFDNVKNRIVAFYIGNMDDAQIRVKMQESVPTYMIPSQFIRLEELPISQNGKIDRKILLEMVGGNYYEGKRT
jgi:Non-ribosomal peptide synthetase modules and related proteins